MTGATDMVTCITYYPGREAELGQALSKSADRARKDAQSEYDLRQKKTYERQVQGVDTLLDTMDGQGGAVGHMSVTVMVLGRDDNSLEQNCQRASTRFAIQRMKLKALANVQKQAFMHLSPYYPAQELIGDMTSPMSRRPRSGTCLPTMFPSRRSWI